MDVKLSIKESSIGKSVELLSLKCDGYINSKGEIYLADSTLTRKASSNVIG